MNISIVMAYHNRRRLLCNTLESIRSYWPGGTENEIIIVDDASDDAHDINDLKEIYDLNIEVIKLPKEEKTWINPCIPFNIGFANANNEIIIIQNPECIHQGNITEYTLNNIEENTYLNYACYSINKFLTFVINNTQISTDNIFESVNEIISPLVNDRVPDNGENGWYNHSIHKPYMLHFCSAIMRKDLYDLGGFDERYANGLGFDDNELIERIRKKQMAIETIDDPFVIHQYHDGFLLEKDKKHIRYVRKMMKANLKLLNKVTIKSDNYDVKMYNDYYT